MTVHQAMIEVHTTGRSTIDITAKVQQAVAGMEVRGPGVATVFVHHTSASLLLNENADPEVRRDLERFLSRLAPDGDPLFRHVDEGPDDMPAHVRTALTATSITIPIASGRCDLGTWQGLYLWEHRHAAHRRRISVTVVA